MNPEKLVAGGPILTITIRGIVRLAACASWYIPMSSTNPSYAFTISTVSV